jgi:uncharacterized protein
MDQRVTVITLGVLDLAVSRQFYVDGLGWTPLLDAGEAVFFQIGHGLVLSLYGRADLARDSGCAAGPGEPPPFSLSQNVDSEAEVDRVVEQLRVAGGDVVAPPSRAPWGGYISYVADPDGFRWEVAHNPGLTVAADGTASFSA